MIVTCVICNKKFEAQKSTKKYCSNECMNAAKRKRRQDQQKGMREKKCILCNNKFIPKTPSANQRTCCYNCMPQGIQLTRSDFIAKLKLKQGGKCIRCGYNTTLKALEFHHLDPSKKDFTISNDKFKLQEAIEEIKKCVLLCSNCHKELHANIWKIEEIVSIRKEEVDS